MRLILLCHLATKSKTAVSLTHLQRATKLPRCLFSFMSQTEQKRMINTGAVEILQLSTAKFIHCY